MENLMKRTQYYVGLGSMSIHRRVVSSWIMTKRLTVIILNKICEPR